VALTFFVVKCQVFSLLAMSLFGGRFFLCSTPGAEYPGGKMECSGSHTLEADDGVSTYLVPRSWDNPSRFHFDDFSHSFLTIYRLGTMKYVSIMYAAMDVTYIDTSPSENFNPAFALFFVLFLILGGFFVVNIIVAFTVDGINVNQGKTDADLHFNEYVAHLRTITEELTELAPASNVVSSTLRRIMDSQAFSFFSAACIAANATFLLTEHADMSEEYQNIIDTQNHIFFGQLAAEVTLRFIAQGPRFYISKKWNIFDTAIAIGLTLTYVGGFMGATVQSSIGKVAKGLRLLRIVRLMLAVRPIRIVFETILISLPQLINVSLVLFLLMFVFAALGMSLYSETRFQNKLGPAANFRTFDNALKVIYQILVGEEWQDLLEECSVQPPLCTEKFSGYSFGDCGNALVTPLFFVILKISCELMMLNLLVGMILDNLGRPAHVSVFAV